MSGLGESRNRAALLRLHRLELLLLPKAAIQENYLDFRYADKTAVCCSDAPVGPTNDRAAWVIYFIVIGMVIRVSIARLVSSTSIGLYIRNVPFQPAPTVTECGVSQLKSMVIVPSPLSFIRSWPM